MKIRIRKWDTIFNAFFFLFLLSINTCMEAEGIAAVFPIITFVLFGVTFLIWVMKMDVLIYINGYFLWYLLFFIYILLSLSWALQPREYIFANFKTYIITLVNIFVLTHYVTDMRKLNLCIKMTIWSMVVTNFILIYNTGVQNLLLQRLGTEIGLNPNDFGIRCAITAIFSFYLYEKEDKRYLVVAIFLGLFAFLSGSRKAFVLVGLGICGYKIVSEKGIKAIKNIVIAIILGLLMLVLIMKVPSLYQMLGRRVESFLLSKAEYSLNERAYYRQEAMKLFYQRKILGWGYDSFKTYMGMIRYRHVAYSHCNYTELLATLGSVGFVIYYGMYIYIFKKLFQYKNEIAKLFLVTLSVIVICEYGLVDFNSYFIQIILCFFYLFIRINRLSQECD